MTTTIKEHWSGMPPTEEEEGRQLRCMGKDQQGMLVVVADSHQVEGRLGPGKERMVEQCKEQVVEQSKEQVVEQCKEQVVEQGKEQVVEQGKEQGKVEQGMCLLAELGMAELGKPLEGRQQQGRVKVHSGLWW